MIELVSDFPEGTLVSSTNKIDYHYIITEMLLNVAIYTNKSLYLRIECILLKFHWGMKALIELHFQRSASC